MNITEAVKQACDESTLIDALSWICVWESERVVEQAHENLTNNTPADANGKMWDTCFKVCIEQVFKAWTIKDLAKSTPIKELSELVIAHYDYSLIDNGLECKCYANCGKTSKDGVNFYLTEWTFYGSNTSGTIYCEECIVKDFKKRGVGLAFKSKD